MLNIVYLTEEFYNDYNTCPEILQKVERPHIMLTVLINGVTFCIPMRSHINHAHVLFTDEKNGCGIDFSKAVVITDSKYIDKSKRPYIRSNEFRELKKFSEFEVEKRMKKYICEYKKAKKNPNAKHNKRLLSCSTLQYFEEYI